MAVFFEGRQTQNSEDNIELGDGGGMTSVVWYFMGWLFFLKNPDSEKTQSDGPMAADKRENDDDTLSEKASGSVWAGVCVWVCLFACAGAYVLIWVVLSELHAATVLTPF